MYIHTRYTISYQYYMYAGTISGIKNTNYSMFRLDTVAPTSYTRKPDHPTPKPFPRVLFRDAVLSFLIQWGVETGAVAPEVGGVGGGAVAWS